MTALTLAASGDLASLRDLTAAAYALGIDAEPALAFVAYSEAITFARLAASHGGRDDLVSLMFLLSELARVLDEQGETALAICFEAQALLVAEGLVESGDEEIAAMVVRAGAIMPAAVFVEARRQKDQAGIACSVH